MATIVTRNPGAMEEGHPRVPATAGVVGVEVDIVEGTVAPLHEVEATTMRDQPDMAPEEGMGASRVGDTDMPILDHVYLLHLCFEFREIGKDSCQSIGNVPLKIYRMFTAILCGDEVRFC